MSQNDMTKEDVYSQQAFEYVRKSHSPSEVSDFQAAMNIAVMKAFIAGAQWADKDLIEKGVKWIIENFPSSHGISNMMYADDFKKDMESIDSISKR